MTGRQMFEGLFGVHTLCCERITLGLESAGREIACGDIRIVFVLVEHQFLQAYLRGHRGTTEEPKKVSIVIIQDVPDNVIGSFGYFDLQIAEGLSPENLSETVVTVIGVGIDDCDGLRHGATHVHVIIIR